MLEFPTYIVFLIFCLIFFISPLYSQDSADEEYIEDGTINVDDDEKLSEEEINEIIFEPMKGYPYLGSDYLLKKELQSKLKSPTGALFRSLVIPGWGQFYNNSWWKGLIFIGGEALTLTYAIKNYRRARDFYNQSLNETGDEQERLYEEYKKHLNRTEKWGWLFTGVVVISMLDAYVDAHLSNYDIAPLEEIEISPYVEEEEVGLIFSRTF